MNKFQKGMTGHVFFLQSVQIAVTGSNETKLCYTVRYDYKATIFLQNPYDKYPIAYPWWWDMGCILWVLTLIYVRLQSLLCCIQNHIVLDRVMTVPDCNHGNSFSNIQYIPRNMHTVFALLCFVVVIHCLIVPYPSGLLHWHCGNLTIAPVPAKQPWWIWINTSCEFIMNDCITTTKQRTTKPCAYCLGYTVGRVNSSHGRCTLCHWR